MNVCCQIKYHLILIIFFQLWLSSRKQISVSQFSSVDWRSFSRESNYQLGRNIVGETSSRAMGCWAIFSIDFVNKSIIGCLSRIQGTNTWHNYLQKKNIKKVSAEDSQEKLIDILIIYTGQHMADNNVISLHSWTRNNYTIYTYSKIWLFIVSLYRLI